MGASSVVWPSSWYWIMVSAGSGHWCHHSSPRAVLAGILLGAVGEVDLAQRAVVLDVLQRRDDGVAVGAAGLFDRLGDDGDGIVGFHRVALDIGLARPLLVLGGEFRPFSVNSLSGTPIRCTKA